MEEKKRISVKKSSVLPYLAAALGGVMLILSFFIIIPSGISEYADWLNGFTVPVIRWFTSGVPEAGFLDLLLLLTAVTLLVAGMLAKNNPVLCAIPSTLFLLFLFIWIVMMGFYGGLPFVFRSWNIPFLLLVLAGCILSLLTVCGNIKTGVPLAVVSFMGVALLLYAIFVVARQGYSGYAAPFFLGYGLATLYPDRSLMLRFLCLFLGTGFLALSLEYTGVSQEQTGVGAPSGEWPRQNSPRLTGLSPTLAERRSIAVCILLSFFTFGIYLIYWKYTLCKKVRAWCGEPEECGGETACLVLVPFYSLYWMYTRGKKIWEASQARGFYAQDNSVVYLLLDLFGLGLVAYGLMQNEFNKIAGCCGGQGAPGAFTPSVPNGPAVPQPAVPQPAAPVKEAPPVEKTVEERLAELRSLLDKGLITQEEFEDKRRDILEKL